MRNLNKKDALRVYVGDTRQRDENGSIIEDKYLDEIYCDEQLYKTLNVLMFEGIENEIIRRKEGTEFNIELLRKPELILDIYCDLLDLAFESSAAEKETKVYRYDRKNSIRQLEKGYTKSFFSTSKGMARSEFSYKIEVVEMEIKICPGVYCIDVEAVLGGEYNRGEAEVLIPPFAPIDIVEEDTHRKGLGVDKRYLINVKPQCFIPEDINNDIQILRKSLCNSERIRNICDDLKRINDGESDETAVKCYIEWKSDFQELIKKICNIKLNNVVKNKKENN